MAPTKKKQPRSDQNSSEKPVTDRKKPGNEIEEIFRAAKGKNKKRKEPSGEGSDLKEKMKKKSREEKGNKEKKVDEVSSGRKKRRKTADGLTIYSAEELGIGNSDAGGTPLCPFDCSCCF